MLPAEKDKIAQIQTHVLKSIASYKIGIKRINWLKDGFSTLKSEYVARIRILQEQYAEIILALNAMPVRLSNLKLHLSGMIAENTNHVVVYALSYDKDGFYCTPAEALMGELHDYLEERRLVNLTHEVLSAADVLKPCSISSRLRIKNGFITDQVISGIQTVLMSLLRGREFGRSLYLSDVYQALQTVEGILSVNVEITADTTYLVGEQSGLDINGNFILAKKEHIITKIDGEINTVLAVTIL